jgi:hypothetical protein
MSQLPITFKSICTSVGIQILFYLEDEDTIKFISLAQHLHIEKYIVSKNYILTLKGNTSLAKIKRILNFKYVKQIFLGTIEEEALTLITQLSSLIALYVFMSSSNTNTMNNNTMSNDPYIIFGRFTQLKELGLVRANLTTHLPPYIESLQHLSLFECIIDRPFCSLLSHTI